MEKKTITVTIFNEQYNLTTELPKKETEAIAEMVDKKMQQFAGKNSRGKNRARCRLGSA